MSFAALFSEKPYIFSRIWLFFVKVYIIFGRKVIFWISILYHYIKYLYRWFISADTAVWAVKFPATGWNIGSDDPKYAKNLQRHHTQLYWPSDGWKTANTVNDHWTNASINTNTNNNPSTKLQKSTSNPTIFRPSNACRR